MQVVEFMDQQHIEINSYTCCSCLLTVTMTKKNPKSQLKATCRGNGYLAYTFKSQSITEGNQGRNFKPKPWKNADYCPPTHAQLASV